MLLGGVGGAAIAAGNVVSLSHAISEGRAGLDLVWPLLAIVFGVLLAGYFGYLAVLKTRRRNGGR